MFSKNIANAFIVFAVLLLFVVIILSLYKTVEHFQATQQVESPIEKELKEKLKKITDRLCPILSSIQMMIAKAQKGRDRLKATKGSSPVELANANLQTITTQTNERIKEAEDKLVVARVTNAEGSPAIATAKKNLDSITAESQKVLKEANERLQTVTKISASAGGNGGVSDPTIEEVNSAFLLMTKEAEHLLFLCPGPDSMVKLPPTFAIDIAATIIYCYNKLTKFNNSINSALDGNSEKQDNENDPYAKYDESTRASKLKKYDVMLVQYNINNQPLPQMTAEQTNFLLAQRLADLNTLYAQTDESGNNRLEMYLQGAEVAYREYSKLRDQMMKGTMKVSGNVMENANKNSGGAIDNVTESISKVST